jgi:hypothetical protein
MSNGKKTLVVLFWSGLLLFSAKVGGAEGQERRHVANWKELREST